MLASRSHKDMECARLGSRPRRLPRKEEVMHTLEAGDAFLNSNADFSGDATISYLDDAGKRVSVSLPGRVFLALAKRALGRSVQSAMESAIDEWIGEDES